MSLAEIKQSIVAGRALLRAKITRSLANPETCEYCRTGRACYQIVEEYGPNFEDPWAPEGMNLIVHQPAN